MNRELFLFLLCVCSFTTARAQFKISGVVVDTASNIKLKKASVSVLNAKDSTQVKFVWSAPDGSFQTSNLKPGKFILLVSCAEYADYVSSFELDVQSPTKEFGEINLTQKAKLLAEVIIKGQANTMSVKGDTLEYDSKYFKIEPNAKVEDMLKQIAGMQVDQNGKITFFGQNVPKVLLEGEEFFGDDPTLITRNIRGDMVDKIQIYDKKSDQATFTGIDDGKTTKTVNIKLKEDKKRGLFGKLTAGMGTRGFYQEQAMLNVFRDKQKFAVFGNLANNGKVGLSGSESDKYGITDANFELFKGGIINSLNNSDDTELSTERYNGEGMPAARTAGAHYDAKWDSDKKSINTNYKIGTLSIGGNKNTQTKNNLETGILNSTMDQNFDNYLSRQKFDVTFQVKLDSVSSLKVAVDGTLKKSEAENNFQAFTLGADNNLLNRNTRLLANNGNQQLLNTSIFYSLKLKKARRTFTAQLNQSANKGDNEGFLNVATDFFNQQGTLISTEYINQYKTSMLRTDVFSASLNYTEPLLKTLSLTVNYATGINNSAAERKSFNLSNGQYNVLDKDFSNDYVFDEFTHKVGVSLYYLKKNENIRFSPTVTSVKFNQLDQYTNTNYKRSFINFSPWLSYNLTIPNRGWFIVTYIGRAGQPTIDQIQPIQINNDPLNIVVGNPFIKPAYYNTITANYVNSKSIIGQQFYLTGSYGTTHNAIVNSIFTNEFGKTKYTWVNLTDKTPHAINLSATYARKISKLELTPIIGVVINNSVTYGFSNDQLIKRPSTIYSARLGISKYKTNSYNLNFRPMYTQSNSSQGNLLDNSGYGFSADALISLVLPKQFGFNTTWNYMYQARTAAFTDDYKVLMVNASLSKKFLKQQNLKLSVSGNDLFNQNVGFTRSSFGTAIVQNSFSTIKRNVMFSLAWDFSKFGTLKTTQP